MTGLEQEAERLMAKGPVWLVREVMRLRMLLRAPHSPASAGSDLSALQEKAASSHE